MTSAFKATGRSQKSMFTQRFIKDFNNLQYEVAGSLIKKSPYKSGSQESKRGKIKDQINPGILIRRTDSAPKI